MTKEERAKKWFFNIPNSQDISMDTKMDICNKVAKKSIILFFLLLVVECILLFILTKGGIFTLEANFINSISKSVYTTNRYRLLGLIGGLIFLPLIGLPLIITLIYKYKSIKSEASNLIKRMDNMGIDDQLSRDPNKENKEDILHFDNINFKLAIIQVLMYDLKLLEPRFDIYDFAKQYTRGHIDIDTCTIIEPAINFFKELAIPKSLAPYIETIYMDGGNEVYMNIIPQWDGEDGCFDLNEVTLTELKQFPNLKNATILSSNFDKIKEIFDAANIEVELL